VCGLFNVRLCLGVIGRSSLPFHPDLQNAISGFLPLLVASLAMLESVSVMATGMCSCCRMRDGLALDSGLGIITSFLHILRTIMGGFSNADVIVTVDALPLLPPPDHEGAIPRLVFRNLEYPPGLQTGR
jgi:hypothetical protein